MELIPGAEYEVTSIAGNYPEDTFKVKYLCENTEKYSRNAEKYTCEITHYVTSAYQIGQKIDLAINRFKRLIRGPIKTNEDALQLLMKEE